MKDTEKALILALQEDDDRQLKELNNVEEISGEELPLVEDILDECRKRLSESKGKDRITT